MKKPKKKHILQRKFVCGEEAKFTDKQHVFPCADCCFSRTSINGWLGSMSIENWLSAAHGEALIDCHVTKNQQCAGAAIYRANVCKLPLSPNLILKPNTKLVFSNPMEFREHHEKKFSLKK